MTGESSHRVPQAKLGYGFGVELHAHTRRSDGELSPTGLVKLARKHDVRLLAVTDHDTFAGVQTATEAAERLGGIVVLPGTAEISTAYHHEGSNKSAHILVYFAPEQAEMKLTAKMSKTLAQRIERAVELKAALASTGLETRRIDYTVVQAGKPLRDLANRVFNDSANKKLLARHEITDFITFYDAFVKPLAGRKLDYPNTFDTIRAIRELGGHAVVAHPGIKQMRVEDDVLRHMVEAGLEGIEVIHPEHSTEEMRKYSALAEKYGMTPTIGMDYHSYKLLKTVKLPQAEVIKNCLKQIESLHRTNGLAEKLRAELRKASE